MTDVLPRTYGCLTFMRVPTTAKSETQRSPSHPVLKVTLVETDFESRGSSATHVAQNSWMISGIFWTVSYFISIAIGLKISAKVPWTWTIDSKQRLSWESFKTLSWTFTISRGAKDARLYCMSRLITIANSEAEFWLSLKFLILSCQYAHRCHFQWWSWHRY